MCNTIPLRCANPRCPQIVFYRPAASSKCYCDHADCQRLRAAERQRRHYREVATTPSRRPEHEAMLARKKAERLRRGLCGAVVEALPGSPATRLRAKAPVRASRHDARESSLSVIMLLVFILQTLIGMLAMLFQTKDTASMLDMLARAQAVGRDLTGPRLENLPLRQLFLTGVLSMKSSQNPPSPG